jgi:phosphohistidine phosphatase
MELILWRHADAEDGTPDEARKLTPKGEKQAEKMAAWLRERLPENRRVIASPAKRAMQTAEALTGDYTIVNQIGTGASAESVLNAAGWPDEDGTVVVVGHQPTIGEVAAQLLSKNAVGGYQVKKGAIWWFSIKDRTTVLKAAVSPSLL